VSAPPGDQVKVSVLVRVTPDEAFSTFTDDIDQWWRRGPRFRSGGILYLEPRVGGRLLERCPTPTGERVIETGYVKVWEPPARLVFAWRAINFAPEEWTEVEVTFEPRAAGTLLTLVHRGWSGIRPEHPARHGLEVAPFLRMMGLWWGDQMTSLREHAGQRGSG
jgi:uncharacterized protein YndB with AHSA1/START domain